ncbi:Zn-dependent hydrolase [Roseibacillus ishigakijimensis]|uniref:Zn-dependent hydrolase n=1 Tax=Roseibacillus ishigakijimensis TaxID=454146 RepID=A0A934VLH4_9BACT|nr:Zn-dependent hydrolase [Roseibacillus ishigakijimensis]MBK1832895.1 Zn-dependent hydrolase [Roseibacillus ishigakijimensis]
MSATKEKAAVSLSRLQRRFKELSEIGLDPEVGGLYRMAFTREDMEARDWLEKEMKEAGLQVSRDGAGNVSGLLEGSEPDLPRVLVGSHLDTVPCAGTLDGSLGVMAALESLHAMTEAGVRPRHSIEVISFSDEEGRFGGMFGSQAVAGKLTPETLHHARDLNGVKLSDTLERHGMDPWQALEARRDPKSLECYLELHIEQGPVLDVAREQVGLVEDITGLFKWSVTLRGEANHAGTTPMDMRQDAFLGMAEFAYQIPRVLEENGSERSRATVGKAELHPGSANTVPGEAIFSLDVRDTDPEILRQLADQFRRSLSAIARRRNLMFEFTVESEIAPVACSRPMLKVLEAKAKELDLAYRRMPSGAAHDAQIMATITPTVMLFVPSRGGKSHSPQEWTSWDDIEAGTKLLLEALLEFGNSGHPGQKGVSC